METSQAWEREGIAQGQIGPIIGAVDETFLQRMMLVFMDLPSGYLLFEEASQDWKVGPPTQPTRPGMLG